MDVNELIVRHNLGAAVAIVHFDDCRVSFHEQLGTGDVWYLAIGPLGTVAWPLIRKKVFLQVLGGWPAGQRSAHRRARERYAKWQCVTISNDLSVALRARGNALEFKYLFADGVPFGGRFVGLPTIRRASLIERAQMWLSGQRGRRVDYLRQR